MEKYDLYLCVKRGDVKLEFEGKVTLPGLAGLVKTLAIRNKEAENQEAPEPAASGKPKLTPEAAYRFLRRGKDYGWFKERYDCKKMEVAGYKAALTRKNGG
ncbi:hypothetical protein KY343_01815 [Candidatus Woesearchaeota archaeon]|nr:hypothetical protein [Candidatus Woesearchaeota archaeon]